jgi:probable rRNA maturation factor
LVILQKTVAALSRGSLERFVFRARQAAGLRGLANVLVTSSAALRALNRQFRDKNSATDVLSFPAARLSSSLNGEGRAAIAGDIAISADIAAENAARFGHTAAEEVKILALHGILHLAGFDHERDNGRMARKEVQLRRRLKLPTALIERTSTERTLTGRAATERKLIERTKPTKRNRLKMSGKKHAAARRTG